VQLLEPNFSSVFFSLQIIKLLYLYFPVAPVVWSALNYSTQL